ncbi:MAG TPA: ATP-binding protein [Hyphomonadaceae bacterium]|nr:ATP-binding protein [Hyphomonadaceae bacterium]
MTGPTNGGKARSIEALRESEELHRATLSAISDAVFLSDDAGAFTYICPNVDVIFGYVPDEVQAMGTICRLLGDNLFDIGELIARGELSNIERDVVSKSGEHRTVLVLIKRVDIKGGTVLYSCRDVTALRAAETELAAARVNLAHAGRLALAGQLARSIMHDVHQPITAIQMSAYAGLNTLGRPVAFPEIDQLRGLFDHIRQASTAASEIVGRVRKLMQKHPVAMRSLDLNAAIGDVVGLLQADAARRGVSLQTELAPGLPTISGDRTGLQQVVLQLATNALEAMDSIDGDRMLTIETRAGAGIVEVLVSDTGFGVAAEHRPLLFEEFFTTKRDGVGLGLSIVRSIVADHGGEITLADSPSRGATFRVMLPLSLAPGHARSDPHS